MNYNDLNETQKLRLTLEQRIWESEAQLGLIRRQCNHTNIAKGRLMYSPRQKAFVQTCEGKTYKPDDSVTVYCQDCDKEFGWYCPVNPNAPYCVYQLEEQNSSYCFHCHAPNERK